MIEPYRVGVVDDGSEPHAVERARYIAALSIGLTTAGRDHVDVVRELTDAADGRPDLLQQASRCIATLSCGDAEHRRTAEVLLLRAATRSGPMSQAVDLSAAGSRGSRRDDLGQVAASDDGVVASRARSRAMLHPIQAQPPLREPRRQAPASAPDGGRR